MPPHLPSPDKEFVRGAFMGALDSGGVTAKDVILELVSAVDGRTETHTHLYRKRKASASFLAVRKAFRWCLPRGVQGTEGSVDHAGLTWD